MTDVTILYDSIRWEEKSLLEAGKKKNINIQMVDCKKLALDLEKKPEALNLINIYSDLTNSSLEHALNELKGKEYSHLKNKLSEVLVEIICPVGKKIKELLDDKGYLEKVLKEGTEKARNLAEYNLKEIRNVIGFF